MAERRMFSQKIIDSDAFLDMPSSTQNLYFHLGMRADDDGFINNPKKISKMVNCSDDDLKLLLLKKFIIGFESGVVVVKHWKIHNYIQKDRYHATNYHEEMALLGLDANNGYTLDTKCVQDVSSGKVRLELGKSKDSIEEDNIVSPKGSRFKKPTIEELQQRANEMGYRFNVEEFYNYYEANGWKVGRNKMKCWKSALANWNNRSFSYGGKKAELLDRCTNERSRSYIVADENTFE